VHYKNSKVIIWGLYIAIALFPAATLMYGYMAYDLYISKEEGPIGIYIIAIFMFGWLSPFGFKLFKFVESEYILSDAGITIKTGDVTKSYKWSPAMSSKESTSLQLFWLYGENGNVLAIVDHKMPGYCEFSKFVKSKISA
jgi:hypothetical protein